MGSFVETRHRRADRPSERPDTVTVVNLADLTDENQTKLAIHPPQATEIVVVLGSMH